MQAELPDITVLLPVYNGELFIAEAVTSILNQTYRNFELLVIDDGSTDQTFSILESLAMSDVRIRLHRRENRGLIATLNEGLALCTTELVARMDADDYAMPERLALQKAHMDAHPDIVVCGSGIQMYESGQLVEPRCHAPFDVLCLFGSPFMHPTIMFRRSVIVKMGGYAADMLAGEDYDLWCRLTAAGYRLDNLPQPLLRYREHPQAPRVAYRNAARTTTRKIWRYQLQKLGLTPTLFDLDVHGYCSLPCKDIPLRKKMAEKWLRKLCQKNRSMGIYRQEDLESECARICAAFPESLSFWKKPLAFGIRMVRHTIMTFCCGTGGLGWAIEKIVRSWLRYMHILCNRN